MDYRFFQYGLDDAYISNVVRNLSRNYQEVRSSEEWFRWRFEQNPCGAAILSCAFDSDKMVACMALEKVPLHNNVFGIVRYAFVQEGYDSNGLIPKLVELLETEVQKQRLAAVLLVGLQDYCSNNSIAGWESSSVRIEYRTKFVKPLRSIFKLVDTEKPFIADAYIPHEERRDDDLRKGLACIAVSDSVWDEKYLQWRYLMARDIDFLYVENQDVFAVAVLGSKGRRIRDVRILMMATKKSGVHLNRFKKVVFDKLVEQTSPDTVSCIDSDQYLSGGNSMGVRQEVPVCYKRFGEEKEVSLTEMVNMVIRYFV